MKTLVSAPVALEREILPKSLLRANLEGQNLVLWRDDANDIQVWADRCPHRSVKLSAGRNNGDCVQCPYHGWTFGKNGAVAHIPAREKDVSSDIKVSSFKSRISGGLVWVSLGEEVNVTEKFSPKSNDILLRPLPVNACAETTQSLLDQEREMTLIATPADESSCVIFGYASPKGDSSQQIRYYNHRLNALRRCLEERTGL